MSGSNPQTFALQVKCLYRWTTTPPLSCFWLYATPQCPALNKFLFSILNQTLTITPIVDEIISGVIVSGVYMYVGAPLLPTKGRKRKRGNLPKRVACAITYFINLMRLHVRNIEKRLHIWNGIWKSKIILNLTSWADCSTVEMVKRKVFCSWLAEEFCSSNTEKNKTRAIFIIR